MSWMPPKSYLELLKKAVQAGYLPNETQKEWLTQAQRSEETTYDSQKTESPSTTP